MNVLCVSYYDNGGQLQQLSNALNKYTKHNAKHINYKNSFLDYDADIKAYNYSTNELQDLTKDRDFFIFSESIPPIFNELKIKLRLDNLIIRCYGTTSRNNVNQYRDAWSKLFNTFTAGGFDPTIHPYLGFVAYHIPNIYNFNKFPIINHSNKIRICHAATNKEIKSTEIIMETLEKLENDFGIEPVLIVDKSWKESLEIKATCNITIDQFILGGYGTSAIESMYLKHTVISRLNPFVRSMHPDIPIVQATLDNLYDVIADLLINEDYMEKIGEQGKNFAIREHSAEINITRWEHLIQWVVEGFQ